MSPPDEFPPYPGNRTGDTPGPEARVPHDPMIATDTAADIDWTADEVTGDVGRSEATSPSWLQGRSAAEIFAQARAWLEERPMTTTLVGFGLGFTLGRLLRRS